MTNLNTSNLNALRYFISETIYSFETPAVKAHPENVAEESTQNEQADNTVYDYLGENDKHILFIVRETTHPFFSPLAMEAFSKTITALGLSFSDLAVLNTARLSAPIDPKSVFSFFNPRKLIFLGSPPEDLGLASIDLNIPIQTHGAISLFTYSFEEMLEDSNKKKTFWLQLKNL